MALGVECPVINKLRLDFGVFTCNLLGSDFVRLLFTTPRQNRLFGQEVVRINSGRPTRCVQYFKFWAIPVAARCKAWVYGRSRAGIVISNSAGGIGVCLL
jgi:hypothetical protein